MSKPIIMSAVLLAVTFVSACSGTTQKNQTIGMPNPASQYCIEQGGRLSIIKTPDGEYGLCTLPNSEQIEEWEFYRKNHPQWAE